MTDRHVLKGGGDMAGERRGREGEERGYERLTYVLMNCPSSLSLALRVHGATHVSGSPTVKMVRLHAACVHSDDS